MKINVVGWGRTIDASGQVIGITRNNAMQSGSRLRTTVLYHASLLLLPHTQRAHVVMVVVEVMILN